MYVEFWRGANGWRLYVKKAIYPGCYFTTKNCRLAWSSKHRESLLRSGGDDYLFWTDHQLKRETAMMRGIAEYMGFQMGQEMSASDLDKLERFHKAQVHAGAHLRAELLRQQVQVA